MFSFLFPAVLFWAAYVGHRNALENHVRVLLDIYGPDVDFALIKLYTPRLQAQQFLNIRNKYLQD